MEASRDPLDSMDAIRDKRRGSMEVDLLERDVLLLSRSLSLLVTDLLRSLWGSLVEDLLRDLVLPESL
jgi:hypothetical protein